MKQSNDYTPRHAANTPDEATIQVTPNEDYTPRHAAEDIPNIATENDNNTHFKTDSNITSATDISKNAQKISKPSYNNQREEKKNSLLWLWIGLAVVALTALIVTPLVNSDDTNDQQVEQDTQQVQIEENNL